MPHISVVIPVGPKPHHREWLKECLDSVDAQTRLADRVVIVKDGFRDAIPLPQKTPYAVLENEMRLGMVASFNRGIANALELAITLGSDDMLMPTAIASAEATYKKHGLKNCWYFFDVEYSDGRTQSIACHASMVHAEWYKSVGGLPPESAVGAPDTMFISMLMTKKIDGTYINIKSPKPLYWYRMHDNTDTRQRGDQRLQTAISLVRDYLADKGPL